jgi:Arc/MetJ-type ribon-helix-helix transcriptional regulator
MEELDERLQEIVRLVHDLEEHAPSDVARFFSSSEAREDVRRAIEALIILPRMDRSHHLPALTGRLPVVQYAEAEAHVPDLVPGHMAVQARHTGSARKVSVSMPEDLTAAVQLRVGRGKFSQYVTEAVARQLELDLLADLSDLLTSEHGAVPEEYLAEARAAWPDEE